MENVDPGEVQQLEEDEIEKELVAARRADARKRQQAWNTDRSLKLGSEPKEARRLLRESLQPGLPRSHQLKEESQDAPPLGIMLHDTGNGLPILHVRGREVPEQGAHSTVCVSGAHVPKGHRSLTTTRRTQLLLRAQRRRQSERPGKVARRSDTLVCADGRATTNGAVLCVVSRLSVEATEPAMICVVVKQNFRTGTAMNGAVLCVALPCVCCVRFEREQYTRHSCLVLM